MKVKVTKVADNETQYGDLTIGNVYRVIGLSGDNMRVMSDEGLPYLYPNDLFEVVDPDWPADWVSTTGDEGEIYAGPASLSAPGFFERVFDGDNTARLALRKRLQHWREGKD